MAIVYSIYTNYFCRAEESSTISEVFGGKRLTGLLLFKILPFVELMIAFFGEFLANKIDPRVVILFCIVYPLLMGVIGRLMDAIDEKLDLNMDLVAELYGLFYASLPYKLVYLDIEEIEIGFIVLVVKLVYKLIIYVIVPQRKHRIA
jgi:hypothetical protein